MGKTFLLNQIYFDLKENNHDVILIKINGILNSTIKNQIYNFVYKISPLLTEEEKKICLKENKWFIVFNFLEKALQRKKEEQKIIFFIDEFAWLHTKKSDFINNFSSFWNNLKSFNVLNTHFLLTASAIAWMTKNVINTKGGLFQNLQKLH